jgi:hypothetical protein
MLEFVVVAVTYLDGVGSCPSDVVDVDADILGWKGDRIRDCCHYYEVVVDSPLRPDTCDHSCGVDDTVHTAVVVVVVLFWLFETQRGCATVSCYGHH